MKPTVKAISEELALPVRLPEGLRWDWVVDLRAEWVGDCEWLLDDLACVWRMTLSEDGMELVIMSPPEAKPFAGLLTAWAAFTRWLRGGE